MELNLENFASTYVDVAFEALFHGNISLRDFDDYVQGEVSRRLNVPEDFVRSLHHPFHWTFFPSNEGHPIFDYITEIGNDTRVGLNGFRGNRSELVDPFLDRYGTLLEARCARRGISTYHQ